MEDFLKNFKGNRFVTNYVFDESVTLIRARLGHEKAVFVGNILLKSSQIEKIWLRLMTKKGLGSFLFQERTNLTALLTVEAMISSVFISFQARESGVIDTAITATGNRHERKAIFIRK